MNNVAINVSLPKGRRFFVVNLFELRNTYFALFILFLFILLDEKSQYRFDEFGRIDANDFVHTSPRFLQGMNLKYQTLQRKNEPQRIRFNSNIS